MSKPVPYKIHSATPIPIQSVSIRECPYCQSSAFHAGYCPACDTWISSPKSYRAAPATMRRSKSSFEPLYDGVDGLSDSQPVDELAPYADELAVFAVDHDDYNAAEELPTIDDLEELPPWSS